MFRLPSLPWGPCLARCLHGWSPWSRELRLPLGCCWSSLPQYIPHHHHTTTPLDLIWMCMYSSQSTYVDVDWSGIKPSSILFHFNTHGLRWIHVHPNKALSGKKFSASRMQGGLCSTVWLLYKVILGQSRSCPILPSGDFTHHSIIMQQQAGRSTVSTASRPCCTKSSMHQWIFWIHWFRESPPP
jgi:hypothetical protein